MNNKNKKTWHFRISEWILSIFFWDYNLKLILEDLEEEFNDTLIKNGSFRANKWLLVQLMKIITGKLYNTLTWEIPMLKNYLLIALRNLKKHSVYALLNVTGLVIGFTSAILILLYVQYELSYDKYHENSDSIYRVVVKLDNKWLGTDLWLGSSGMLKPTIDENIPGIINSTRIFRNGGTVLHNKNRVLENRIFMVEPEFLDMFSFPLVSGDGQKALSKPLSLLLTEQMVSKYFGDENPIGKTLTIDENIYTVTGILQDIPPNSHFRFDFLTSFSTLFATSIVPDKKDIERWGYNIYATYIQLDENIESNEIGQTITKLAKKIGERPYDYMTQKLTDIHLHSHINREIEPNSDIRYVYIFSAVAVLLILLACFNYLNLSTAQIFQRAKEVGVRKIVGANRKQISFQFFVEAVLLSFIAFILSIILIKLILPLFSAFVEKDLSFNFINDSGIIALLIIITFFVGIISGSYPALILSGFNPIVIIKGFVGKKTKKTTAFRNTLVVFQFVISIVMIVSTIVMYNQLNYISNKKLGFDAEHILTFQVLDSEFKKSYNSFRDELLINPKIKDITFSTASLDFNNWGGGSAEWEGKQDDEQINIYRLIVDYNFFDFYNIKLNEGRFFSKDMVSDNSDNSYILNQAGAKAIGWEAPLGKRFQQWSDKEGIIIGIVDDFHFQSLKLNVEPLVISLPRDNDDIGYISIKIDPDNISDSIGYIAEIFNEFSPGWEFNFTFLDDKLDAIYRSEQRLGSIFTYFTSVAILIACLGLLGLGSFMTEKRAKEIGIRKILGASLPDIFGVLSADIFKCIGIAAVIACPAAAFMMNRWLQGFAYKINLNVGIFIAAISITILISFLTMFNRMYKAARSNPIDTLRSE